MPKAAKSAAERFRALHQGPDLLILPNCWDAASAKVMAQAGAKVIATSSAALAWSCGYADGDKLPVRDLINRLEQIVRVCPVPVSADIEGGYTDNLDDFCEIIRWVIGAGVVGVNLEDRAVSPGLLCAKLEQARKAADREGVPLFLNARTDVMLKKTHVGEAGVTEVIRRGGLYAQSGADGLFVPLLSDEGEIAAVVGAIKTPLNLIAWPGLPSGARLQALGVRRVSSATWPARVALDALRRTMDGYLASGDVEPMIAASGERVDYNALF